MANKKNLKQNRKGKAEPEERVPAPPPSPEPDPVVAAAAEAGIIVPTNLSAEHPGVPEAPEPTHDTIHIGAGPGAVHVEVDPSADAPTPQAPESLQSHDKWMADLVARTGRAIVDSDPLADSGPGAPVLLSEREIEALYGRPERPFQRWDDSRLWVADIERHAHHSHGLTPDTDLLKQIAAYIRESFGVTEADVPKP